MTEQDPNIGHNGGPSWDYGEDPETLQEADEGQLEYLTRLAGKQRDQEEDVAQCEARLKEAQRALKQTAEYDIPKALLEAGMEDFTTTDGLTISVKETLRCSMPPIGPRRDEAIEWAEENGLGPVVKRKITIEFDKGEEAWARQFIAQQKRRKKPLKMKLEATIHAQTLKSQLTTLLEDGEDIPLELFSGFIVRQSKLKQKKKPKAKEAF